MEIKKLLEQLDEKLNQKDCVSPDKELYIKQLELRIKELEIEQLKNKLTEAEQIKNQYNPAYMPLSSSTVTIPKKDYEKLKKENKF